MRDLRFTNRHKTPQNHTGFPGKWKGKDVFFLPVLFLLVFPVCVFLTKEKKSLFKTPGFLPKVSSGSLRSPMAELWQAGLSQPILNMIDQTQVQNIYIYIRIYCFLDDCVKTLLDLVGWKL